MIKGFNEITSDELVEINGGFIPDWLITTVIVVGLTAGLISGIGKGLKNE